MKNFLFLLCTILTITACEPPEVETDTSYEVTCTFSGIMEFNIGVDPTSDFDVDNIGQTTYVNSSDCGSPTSGYSNTINFENVTRVGNQVTFTNLSETDNLTASGLNITVPPTTTTTSNGKTITAQYTNGVISSTTNKITFNYQATVKETIYSGLNSTDNRREFKSNKSFKSFIENLFDKVII